MRPNNVTRWFEAFLSVILFFLSGSAQAQSAPPVTAQFLVSGTTIERELESGQTHTYQLALDANQCVKIVATQLGIDVALQLLSPDGKTAREENHSGIHSSELLLWVSPAAGYYQLKISVAEKSPTVGKYALRAEINEPEQSRITAFQKFAEAWEWRWREPDKYQQAISFFEATLSSWRSAKEPEIEAVTLRQLGFLNLQLRNATVGINYYQQALAGFQALGQRSQEALVLNELGAAWVNEGDYVKARPYLEAALTRSIYLSPTDVANAYYDLGVVLQGLSKQSSALEFFQKALLAFRALGEKDGELLALSDVGRTYYAQGEMVKSLEYAHQGLALSRTYQMPIREARFAQDIGRVYEFIGDYEQALNFCQQALQLFRAAKYVGGETAVLILIGDIQKNLGDTATALESYKQAENLARLNKLQEAVGRVSSRLGEMLGGMKEFSSALSYSRQALTYFHATGNRRSEINSLVGLGRTYGKMNDKKKSEEYLQQALTISREAAGGFGELNILGELSLLAQDAGDLTRAQELLGASLTQLAIERQKLVTPSLSLNFSGNAKWYEVYTDVLMQLHEQRPAAGNNILALEFAELSRSQSLLDLLAQSRVDLKLGADPVLLERQKSLQSRLQEALSRQSAGHQSITEKSSPLQQEITELKAQLQLIEAQLRTANPQFTSLIAPPPLTVAILQQKLLDPDTALLEFTLTKKRSYLWIVTKDSCHSFILPSEVEIESAVRRLLELLPKSQQRKYHRETELAAAEVSQLILMPAAAHLNKKRLVIVADGILQYVPFGALPDMVVGGRWSVTGKNVKASQPPVPSYQPLIKDHEIISLPSASALVVLRQERQGYHAAEKTLAVFSDPVFQADDPRVLLMRARRTIPDLPTVPTSSALALRALARSAEDSGILNFKRLSFARQEAESIAALLPKEQQFKALDFTASRAAALNGQLEKYRIIHFATHSMLNSQHPDLSGVVLSLVDENGKPQDGFLRLNDLYNLKLNADLVVLSACSTALGKDIKGEGLVGLTRGFMYAGAARVVASLWNVNDAATAELMQKFYRAMLIEKMAPAAALRSAQLAMVRDPRWSSPYYWSGFVLQGEWQ